MKRIICIISSLTLILTLTGCGLFKNSSKSKSIDELEEVIVVEKKDTSITELKERNVDKDVNITITETTTKRTTKGTDTKVSVRKGDFDGSGKAEITDSLGRKIVLSLDTLTEVLNIIIEAPEVVEETTTRKTEQTDRSKERETTDRVEKVAILNTREERETYKKQTEKESKVSPVGLLLLFAGIVIVVVGIVWGIKRFVFKR